MEVIAALTVSVFVLWIVLVSLLVIARPPGVDLAEAKRLVPDVLRLVRWHCCVRRSRDASGQRRGGRPIRSL